MIDFYELVYRASESGASDFHLTVGMPPIYRIDGDLVDATDTPLQEEDVAGVVRIKLKIGAAAFAGIYPFVHGQQAFQRYVCQGGIGCAA